MDATRTLTVEKGERLTILTSVPAAALAECVGIPRPTFFGSAGPDTVDAQGIHITGESSAIAFESWVFSQVDLEDYARQVAGHLGATLIEPVP